MFDLCYNYTFNGSVINLELYILMKITSVSAIFPYLLVKEKSIVVKVV